jgi:archaellum biogenesis protein FlaJ (TadC family)
VYKRLTIDMSSDGFFYLFAIFVGCLIRTLAPFIRKWMADEIEDGWNHKYTATLIISYIIAMVATAMVYQQNPLDFTNGDTIFVKGLILGVTSNTIITEIAEWFFPDED